LGRGYEEKLFASLFVIGAPGGVGALRAVAGAAPVPFTTVAENDVHSQGFLYFEFYTMPQRWPGFHIFSITS